MSNHVGDLVLRSNYSDTGSTVESVTILRSDPVILIAAELLDQLRSAATPTHGVTLVDDVLTIRATNRTAVYHIGDYEHLLRAYRAEWPDQVNCSPVDQALTAACKARDDIGAAIQAHVETIARERQAIKTLCAQAAEIDDTIDQLLERRLA